MRNPLAEGIEMATARPNGTESSQPSWVATAPCNHGVYDPARAPVTVEVGLSDAAAAGASGIDLGPLAWWGPQQNIPARLDVENLSLAGGWLQLGALDEPIPDPTAVLDALARGWRRGPAPALTVAAPSTRQARCGVPAQLDDQAWDHLLDQVAIVTAAAHAQDIPASFHPHIGTWVESDDQVLAFLERSDTGLCLDTGHLALGGVDLVALADEHGDRVNQVHLKDVDITAFRRLADAGEPVEAAWAGEVFVPLGDGDLDLLSVVGRLGTIPGWWVIEQDAPFTDVDHDRVVCDQVRNVATTIEWMTA